MKLDNIKEIELVEGFEHKDAAVSIQGYKSLIITFNDGHIETFIGCRACGELYRPRKK